MLDLGHAVESLGGRYVTAEDVGTGTDDMAIIGERTAHVVGRPADAGGSGDPSPVTARGVEAAIRACCEQRYGSPDLAGRVVTIAGIGHVGLALAERLAEAGCELRVSDIDEGKREVAKRLGALWVDPERAASLNATSSRPAPSAARSTRSPSTSCVARSSAGRPQRPGGRLPGRGLTERGILYAPDFIANAGGLINVYGSSGNWTACASRS